MKRAVFYTGLSLMVGAVTVGTVMVGAGPAMAQNTTPDGTPARSCLYVLKSGEATSIAVPAGTNSPANLCDTLGDKQFGKGNYQVKGRQCVWPGGETGDADHTTDYTNACSTAWVLGQ